MHGYELMQRLTQCGLEHLDQGNLYRMLRQMEKDQLVVSSWDTSAAGPAKRLYELTEEGKKSLKRHAVQMERYQSLIQQFFNRYASMLNRVMPTR
ncbi:helix-turn-helix transcriptional regulator [Alicyclobacillus cycloheptanicus]|nr:helix-turn-helix transcriptional regulator [Alicyclobacillus cycloheptanicus]